MTILVLTALGLQKQQQRQLQKLSKISSTFFFSKNVKSLLLMLLIQGSKAQNRINHYDNNDPNQPFTWKGQANLPTTQHASCYL